MWDNAAFSLLERTLDDSANRRLVLPEAFLLTDEALSTTYRLVDGLQIWQGAIDRNLDAYGAFAGTERVLMEAVKAGGDRQILHEAIREHSLVAWGEVQASRPNPLADLLADDECINSLIPEAAIRSLLQSTDHVGDAERRALSIADRIRTEIGGEPDR